MRFGVVEYLALGWNTILRQWTYEKDAISVAV